MQEQNKTALVIFGKHIPNHLLTKTPGTVIAYNEFREQIEKAGGSFVDIETLIGPGNVYAATAFLETLSRVTFSNGERVSKWFKYEGFEMWWIHYTGLFYSFALPLTQNEKLLQFLIKFKKVTLCSPQHKSLFASFLHAHSVKVSVVETNRYNTLPSPGILLQLAWTVISIPVLMVLRKSSLVFVGDKIEKGKDYDFRMQFVYAELRKREVSFVEFIRSLESFLAILKNISIRKRPVIYSEAIAYIGRLISLVWRSNKEVELYISQNADTKDPQTHFKYLVATHYLKNVFDDIWGTRIMKSILALIGVRAGLYTAALDRNFHTVLGCKLNMIPTAGILHGVASRYSTPYDYLSGFDGEKTLTVDSYGVWSEWWKEQYSKESDAYKPEQLFVSGPMRPLVSNTVSDTKTKNQKTQVLFIAEQTAHFPEVLPYIERLISEEKIDLTIKFRPFRDGAEQWFLKNHPEILTNSRVTVVKGTMQDAIRNADVVVGCHSTAVLEGLLQFKVPIFIHTDKWGDYYEMERHNRNAFISKNPEELIEKIMHADHITKDELALLQKQYFGDPKENGSAWLVGKIQELLARQ